LIKKSQPNKLKIALFGAQGRMGKSIISLCNENPDSEFLIQGLIDKNFSENQISEILGNCNAALEFIDNPEDSVITASLCAAHRIPLLIGTTGHSEQITGELKNISKTIPLMVTSNTSKGIALLINLIKKTVSTIDTSFDIEIIESHHKNKLDSPSGTALKILDSISKSAQNNHANTNTKNSFYSPVFGRQGKNKRQNNEIGIHSIRAGSIIGNHSVKFTNDYEEITISHKALDRTLFARGALDCIKFLYNKKPGFYTMEDMLENEKK
jgi:4-hydroxy-tetrahydrodipicolinate reductase